eukprot:Opistho-2@57994
MMSLRFATRLQPTRLAMAALAQPVEQQRGMATLKEIRARLKSVKNMEKITKSMKMVSAAKFARAERNLRFGRVLGVGATALSDKTHLKPDADKPNRLLVVVSSDRGLCGAIHSSVCKHVRAELAARKEGDNIKLAIVGDKARTIIQRTLPKEILMHFTEVGKKPATFTEASAIAQEIINSGYEFETAKIIFNRFKTAISYETTNIPVVSLNTLQTAEELTSYEIDDDILESYQEFTFANALYYAFLESNASELSARMTAMDGASKNAGEMIQRLTLTFNRTRQAVITSELIEIISGAAALD